MRRKYRFKDRAEAERAVVVCDQQLTLHRIALDALLRDEFTWTDWFTGPGPSGLSRFQMGIARASAAHGGIVVVREQYGDQKPSQSAYWADGWMRNKHEDYIAYSPQDAESRAYRDCYLAVRSIQNLLVKEANCA